MTATPWDIEGKWSVSPYAYSDEIRATMPNLPKKVEIRDVTFREGEHCIGFKLSTPEKIKLLKFAVEMGIEEIDIGGPSLHPHHLEFCKAVKESGIKVRTTGRFFANRTKDYKRDVDLIIESGSTNLRIILMKLNEKMVLEQLERLPEMVDYIHSCGKEVCVGMSDGTRSSIELIDKIYDGIVACGVDKVGIYDTFGVGMPAVVKYLSERIKGKLRPGMGFECHMHNTYGLGTANSLACVEGGCNSVDTAINGYGDEAGNASLEEVAVCLEAFYGIDTALKLKMLKDYSELAVNLSKVPIQPHKAIVGENAYLRPKIVWGGMDMSQESWMTHEALSPEAVGAKDYEHVVFGGYATLDDDPIKFKLKEIGMPYTSDDIDKMRKSVEEALKEERVTRRPRPYVTEEEFEQMAKKMLGK
jgi:methanogen homocitrate synthase